MSFIFLDESGDLGFDFSKKKTSSVFVVTFLFVKNKDPIEKIVKKIYKNFSRLERAFHRGCLHCHKETPKTRKQVFNLMTEKDITIMSIYLNKKKVFTNLHDEKHVLYNYVTNILIDRVYAKKLIPIDRTIKLIASRRETNKFLNQNFKEYLENKVVEKHKLSIDIQIKAPYEEKCLQVVDFASWAIYRKLQHNDEDYYNLIKQKIVEISPLFP
ncbi:DUF3800 domain-containing protein [Patescibacteria group bacterium]|nr:DUF3800 domain-containing protein [Patescibacteria group bacterium]